MPPYLSDHFRSIDPTYQRGYQAGFEAAQRLTLEVMKKMQKELRATKPNCYCKIIGTECWGNDCRQCSICTEKATTHEIEGWKMLVDEYIHFAEPEKIVALIESLLTHQQGRIIAALEGMKNGIKHTHMAGCFDCSKDDLITEAIEVVRSVV